ncbi:MAG: dockerin type I repeat-containing protein [Planctomycetes bacterium]|nr:dockerin type I repeat-containing protein [Planctomycetota bacterium]
MGRKWRVLPCVGLLLPAVSIQAAGPEDFAIWLEQVPGTTDVVVVASWVVDGIQGWSFGVCFQPSRARITGHDEGDGEWTRCDLTRGGESCIGVSGPEDLMTFCNVGNPPNFNEVTVFQNGVTHGVVCLDGATTSRRATDRCELLRISFTGLADRATLAFCDTLGQPPVPTVIVAGGYSHPPARQAGLVLAFPSGFLRGDANADGAVDIADAVYTVTHLFDEGSAPPCLDAADANDDGRLDVADPIAILDHLFASAGPLPEPFGACGDDPTEEGDPLDCLEYEACE